MKSARLLLITLMLLAVSAPVWAGPFQGKTGGQSPEDQASQLLQNGQPDQAIAVLKQALTTAPNSPGLHFHLGEAYFQTKQYALAEEEFRTVLKQDPNYLAAHDYLVTVFWSQASADKTKAENLKLIEAGNKEMEAALKKEPTNFNRYYQLASGYVRTTNFREQDVEGGYAKALDVLKELEKRAPGLARPQAAIGEVLANHAFFLAGGRPLSALPPDLAKRVDALFSDAIVRLQKALELDPKLLPSLSQLIEIQGLRGREDEGIAYLRAHIAKLEEPKAKAYCIRMLAQHLLQKEKFQETEEQLRLAIKIEPDEPANQLLLSEVYLRQNQVPKAVDALKEAVKGDPKFINGQVQLALLLRKQNDIDGAIEHFKAALYLPVTQVHLLAKERPADQMLFDLYRVSAVQLADIYCQKGDWDSALESVRRLGLLFPASAVPDFSTGEVYQRQGKPDLAKEMYLNALRKDKKFGLARVGLATLAMQNYQDAPVEQKKAMLGEAILQYELILKETPGELVAIDRAANLRIMLAGLDKPKNQEVLKKAQADVEKALERAPDNDGLRLRLAQILNEMDNKAAAIAEIKKVIDATGKDLDKDKDNIDLMLRLASQYMTWYSWQPDKDALKLSLEKYNAVVTKQPQYFDVYLGVGATLEKLKEYPLAAEWYVKLLNAAKGDVSPKALPLGRPRDIVLNAAAELAWIYVENIQDLAKAKEYAAIAEEINPSIPSLVDTVGWIYYRSGQYADAVKKLEVALKSNPDDAAVLYHLGAAMSKAKMDGAKAKLEDALRKAGDDAELKAKIQQAMKE